MLVLSEVFDEFLDLKEINPKPSEQSVRRLIEVAGDLPVDQYTRSHAKAFLASYHEQKTSTRRRRLQCLTSILNFAYWEYDIDKRNPFSRIIIKGEGKDVTSREPFSVAELKKLYSASLAYGQLRLILPILGETGCRLSEVLGLMKQDVIHSEDLLVINIRENSCRGLKTENSKRSLPVVSVSATKALKKLLGAKSDSLYLFPRYASCGYLNNTGASATLCKHLKKSFNGKTTHCLRHSFRDRLRDSDVPLEAIDQAGGWSSVGGVGTNYGKGYSMPKLADYLRRIAI
ncbi:MAG: tyrosine-type recombinase/integrase [Rhodobacteraceae bacterium]|jgi:integrase|nr:tyrosine-type recombinase/integrase [Paracoccaceae bacterium]